MEIVRAHARDIHVVEWDGTPLDSPFYGEAFAMLVVARRVASHEEKAAVLEPLVRAGCRYIVCWGVECTQWDTAGDYASMNVHGVEGALKPEHFVSTTWHDDEPLEEAVWHLLYLTSYEVEREDDFVQAERFLVVLVGGSEAEHADTRAALASTTF